MTFILKILARLEVGVKDVYLEWKCDSNYRQRRKGHYDLRRAYIY
jgi:hypothetical protein